MATYVPQVLAFAETAPVIAEASDVVTATRAEVWAALCDHEGWTDWMSALTSCTPTSTPASGVGSTRTVTLSGGVSFDEEFIAWDEPEVWAFTGKAGPPILRSLVERVTLVEIDPGHTQITYRMALEPRRGFTPLVKVARRSVEANLRKALRNLDTTLAERRG